MSTRPVNEMLSLKVTTTLLASQLRLPILSCVPEHGPYVHVSRGDSAEAGKEGHVVWSIYTSRLHRTLGEEERAISRNTGVRMGFLPTVAAHHFQHKRPLVAAREDEVYSLHVPVAGTKTPSTPRLLGLWEMRLCC